MTYQINFKPGLVLNRRSYNYFGKTIQIGMGHYYSHTFWIRAVNEDKVQVQQAEGRRAKKIASEWVPKEYFNNLFNENRLAVLDFGIQDDDRFREFCNSMEGTSYDYFALAELFIARLISIFGLTPLKFLNFAFFRKFLFFMKKDFTTPKRTDCSELIARGISELRAVPVLDVLHLQKYELVTPQDISVLHMKLKVMNRI